jgi:hypothetical protein
MTSAEVAYLVKQTALERSAEATMITLEDCLAFCGLTEDEVLAIAEHERVPEIAACALAERLLGQCHGPERIRDMIVDDIRAAYERGDLRHVRALLPVLHHFLNAHPEVRPNQTRRCESI